MRVAALLLVLCGSLFRPAGAVAQAWGVRLGGAPLASIAPPGTRAVVLFFVATDCPVSNRMFPEMQRLQEKFGAQGVRVWFVYPNTTERVTDVAEHQHAFDPGGEALLDPAGALVRLSHAVATPEMSVLVPQAQGWRPVYTGRIDNRYIRLGLERPAATEHFGEEVLNAVLAGKTPRAPEGSPVGCAIVNPGVR